MSQENQMVEPTYFHHPYKPKQHFAYYNIANPSMHPNFDIYEPPTKVFKQHHDHSLAFNTKIDGNLNDKSPSAVGSFKAKHGNIPCVVCADASSGFHYGIYSCEGCKGFFRRSLHQETSYFCKGFNNCEINSSSRNSCQSCRLKKCLMVGMSRDGSRLGRPPKRLYSELSSTDSIPTDTVESMPSKKQKINFPECLFRDHQNIVVPNIHQEVQRKLLSILIYQERLITHIEVKELDQLAELITDSHRQFCPNTIEKIQKKIKDKPPVLADSIFGELDHNPLLIYSNWQRSFPFKNLREIFQSYPFYQQITKSDQICLLRYGIFETLLVSWFTFFDAERNSMLTPDFSAYMNRDFIKTMKILGLFMLDIFDLGMKASHFQWTDEIIALFNAILMMNSERQDLSEKSRIEQIEAKLMQVFYRHLRRNCPNQPNLFLDILQLIPSIQEISKLHLNAIRHIKRYERRIFHSLPHIHREIYAGLWS